MRRITLAVVLLLLLAGTAFGQGRNLRVGYITITQWLQTMRGAPLLNLGYYDQTYSSNIRDAFKINYTGSGHYLMRLQGDGSNVFTIDKSGNVWMGGALTVGNVVFDRIALAGSAINNDRYLNLEATFSAPTSDQYGIFSEVIEDTGVPAGRRVVAIAGTARYTGAGTHDRLYSFFGQTYNDSTGTLSHAYGIPGLTYNASSGTISQGFGLLGWCRNLGSGTITEGWGVGGSVHNVSTGLISNAYALEGAVRNFNAGGTIDKAYGLIMYDWSNAGTVNESYGIYMDTSIDVGTLRYALYSSSTSDSYFAGDIGIGIETPEGRVHIYSDDVAVELFIQEISVGAAAQICFEDTSRRWILGSDSSPEGFFIYDGTSDQTVFHVDYAGEVGIGHNTESAKLHVLQVNAADAFRVDDELSDTTPFLIDQSGNVSVGGSIVLGVGTKHDGYVVSATAELQTIGAGQTTLKSLTLMDENTYHVEAWIIGVQSDGTDRASYHLAVTVYRTGAGGATLQGPVTSMHTQESAPALDATFTVNGSDLRVSVTGIAAETWEWGSTLKYINMSN